MPLLFASCADAGSTLQSARLSSAQTDSDGYPYAESVCGEYICAPYGEVGYFYYEKYAPEIEAIVRNLLGDSSVAWEIRLDAEERSSTTTVPHDELEYDISADSGWIWGYVQADHLCDGESSETVTPTSIAVRAEGSESWLVQTQTRAPEDAYPVGWPSTCVSSTTMYKPKLDGAHGVISPVCPPGGASDACETDEPVTQLVIRSDSLEFRSYVEHIQAKAAAGDRAWVSVEVTVLRNGNFNDKLNGTAVRNAEDIELIGDRDALLVVPAEDVTWDTETPRTAAVAIATVTVGASAYGFGDSEAEDFNFDGPREWVPVVWPGDWM